MIAARSKQCFKCGQTKAIGEFYRHSQMADGHLNKCKECTKQDVFRNRGLNLESVQEYDRRRGRTDARRVKNQLRRVKAMETEEGRRRLSEYKQKWARRNREKRYAHGKVQRAILAGLLVRQPCELCGRDDSHAHHDDYLKPLEVRWLCPACHGGHHAKARDLERAAT